MDNQKLASHISKLATEIVATTPKSLELCLEAFWTDLLEEIRKTLGSGSFSYHEGEMATQRIYRANFLGISDSEPFDLSFIVDLNYKKQLIEFSFIDVNQKRNYGSMNRRFSTPNAQIAEQFVRIVEQLKGS